VREGKRLVENKVISEEQHEKGQSVVYPCEMEEPEMFAGH